jgi:hypothetical protein
VIKRVFFIGVALVGLPLESQGLVITLDSAYREVNATARWNTAQDNSATAGLFQSAVDAAVSAPDYCMPYIGCFPNSASAHASQDSNLVALTDSLSLIATFASSVDPGVTDSGSTYGESSVRLDFTTDSPTQYLFTWTRNTGYPWDQTEYFTLMNLDTGDYVFYGGRDPWSGIMNAGRYEFNFGAVNRRGSVDDDISLSVSPVPKAVPEPTTLVLLVGGLLVGWRRLPSRRL